MQLQRESELGVYKSFRFDLCHLFIEKNTLESKEFHLGSINQFFRKDFSDRENNFWLVFVLVTNWNGISVASATSRAKSVKKF